MLPSGLLNPADVSPPCNSFVNLFFRTGLSGTIPLVALVLIGLARLLHNLRRLASSSTDRALDLELVTLFMFLVVVASFNAALEVPYLAIFFWLLLALMLVRSRLPHAATSPQRGDVADQARFVVDL